MTKLFLITVITSWVCIAILEQIKPNFISSKFQGASPGRENIHGLAHSGARSLVFRAESTTADMSYLMQPKRVLQCPYVMTFKEKSKHTRNNVLFNCFIQSMVATEDCG